MKRACQRIAWFDDYCLPHWLFITFSSRCDNLFLPCVFIATFLSILAGAGFVEWSHWGKDIMAVEERSLLLLAPNVCRFAINFSRLC